jgi:hypothetical protein
MNQIMIGRETHFTLIIKFPPKGGAAGAGRRASFFALLTILMYTKVWQITQSYQKLMRKSTNKS